MMKAIFALVLCATAAQAIFDFDISTNTCIDIEKFKESAALSSAECKEAVGKLGQIGGEKKFDKEKFQNMRKVWNCFMKQNNVRATKDDVTNVGNLKKAIDAFAKSQDKADTIKKFVDECNKSEDGNAEAISVANRWPVIGCVYLKLKENKTCRPAA